MANQVTNAQRACDHGCHFPKTEEAIEAVFKHFSSTEIRRYWPRFDGTCALCGYRGIYYADYAQYIGGDY